VLNNAEGKAEAL